MNKEVLFSISSSVLSAIVNFYIISRLIDYLGVSQYASYIFLWVTITTLGNIVGLSTGAFFTTFIASDLEVNKLKIKKTIIASVYVLALFVLLIAAFVLARYSDDFSILILSVSSLILCALDSALKGALVGLKKMRIFLECVVLGLVTNVILIELLKNTINISMALASYLVAELVIVGYVLFRLRFLRNMLLASDERESAYRGDGVYGSYFVNTAAASLFPLALWLVYQMLEVYFEPEATTQFNVSYQFFTLITFVPVVANRVLVPVILSKPDQSQLSYVLKVSIINFLVGSSVFFILYFFADWFFQVAEISIRFSSGINYLMASAALFAVVAAPFGQYFMSDLDVKSGFIINLAVSLTLIGCLFIFSFQGSLTGVAVSFNVAYVINLVIVGLIIKYR